MSIKGIIFNGKHSYYDMGITMTGERQLSYPRKRKIKVAPPYSNKVYDFSNLYGDQVYDERLLNYRFNVINFNELTIESVEHLSTMIVNWLMNSKGKQELIDPYIPGYYFMAEVEGDINLESLIYHGILDVTFVAYPFKISQLPEGNDIWDTFNFDLDVVQETEFTIQRPAQDGSDFKELPIGSLATVGAWATQYGEHEGERAPIPRSNLGISSEIKDIIPNDTSISNRAYYLEGYERPFVEQDIIQAYTKPLELTLINPGTASVSPTVHTNAKISIIKDQQIYNFFGGQNDLFRLDSGENYLKIYSVITRDISFEFYKELI